MWVHLSDAGSQLTITWNRSSPFVEHARSAEIVIIDGGKQTAKVPLDKESLSRGTIIYPRRSGNVESQLSTANKPTTSIVVAIRKCSPLQACSSRA